MKKLLFLMCLSFQLSAMVDGDTDIGQDTVFTKNVVHHILNIKENNGNA